MNENYKIKIGPHEFDLTQMKSWDYAKFCERMKKVFGDQPGFDYEHAWILTQQHMKTSGLRDLMDKHHNRKKREQREQKLKIGMKLTHRN